MAYKYSQKFDKEKMARALGSNLPISTKQSIEICSLLRGRKVSFAEKMLNDAVTMEKPIPFRRFVNGAGHKPGMAAGKYPIKTATEILNIIKLAKANAAAKNMDVESLFISHISAQKGGKRFHYGRVRGKMKVTHIEMFVQEIKEEKKKIKSKNKKQENKEETKSQ